MTTAYRIPFVALALVSPMLAQADWYSTDVAPKARAVHAAAYDQARNQVVMFGGNANAGVQGETWLWSPSGGWSMANPAVTPPPLREHAMAYDAANQEVVLFGGWDGTQFVDDTWIWNGTTWRNAASPSRPSPRMGELAFDPLSQQMILFGGQDATGARLSDTWSWNGTNWTQLAPTQVPPGRVDHAMATDWIRGQIVMFAGWNSAFLGDTWIWTGTDWAQGAVTGPSARSEHKMALVGVDIILFAGDSSAGRQNDTWSWNGVAWSQLSPNPAPGVREEHIMVEVLGNGSALMFGGWHSATGHLADTWSFASGQWTQLSSSQPIGAGTAAAAHDPTTGITLMFGGYTDQVISGMTWAHAAGSWTQLTPLASPPARAEVAMAFDRVRGEFVLFGGANGSTYYNDTWIYRGGNWALQPTTGAVPSTRWGHSMAFDESRGTTVLFGGYDGATSTNLRDTWEWNGTSWTQLTPTSSPSGRHDSAMVYDSERAQLILFGGWAGRFSGDTWAFRAGNWVALNPITSPSPRSEHTMAYDRLRDRVVLFGGEDASGRVADTWEFESDWVLRSPTHSPLRREEAIMVFDEQAGETVLAVGWDLGHFTDTWSYGVRPPATSVPFGTSCQGAAPAAPVLTSGLPWLGDSVLFTTSNVPANGGAVLLLGLTVQSVPLDPIGMIGCVLATSPVAFVTMTNGGGSATVPFGVPLTPALVGAQLVAQAAVIAPGANPAGILTTNGLDLGAAMR